MNTNLTPSNPQRNRIHPLVAGAAVAVILASATGIAAMTGLLPTSHAVTEPAQPVTTAAAQVASAPVAVPQPSALQQTAQQPVQQTVQQTAPAHPRVHHTHSAPTGDAPRYANNQGYQAPYQAAPARPLADPYAGEVVAINTVQAPEPLPASAHWVARSRAASSAIRSAVDAARFSPPSRVWSAAAWPATASSTPCASRPPIRSRCACRTAAIATSATRLSQTFRSASGFTYPAIR